MPIKTPVVKCFLKGDVSWHFGSPFFFCKNIFALKSVINVNPKICVKGKSNKSITIVAS